MNDNKYILTIINSNDKIEDKFHNLVIKLSQVRWLKFKIDELELIVKFLKDFQVVKNTIKIITNSSTGNKDLTHYCQVSIVNINQLINCMSVTNFREVKYYLSEVEKAIYLLMMTWKQIKEIE